MSHDTETEQRTTLRRIINAAHTAFLVTNSPDKGPHGRPMVTGEVAEAMSAFYFPTDKNSGKVEELASDDRVFLGYVSGNEWASVSGRGSIVSDRAKIKEIWTDLWKNWFEGPDDPKLVLIQVTPELAEYWDSNNRAIVLAKMAYTAVTGQKTKVGDHAKLSL